MNKQNKFTKFLVSSLTLLFLVIVSCNHIIKEEQLIELPNVDTKFGGKAAKDNLYPNQNILDELQSEWTVNAGIDSKQVRLFEDEQGVLQVTLLQPFGRTIAEEGLGDVLTITHRDGSFFNVRLEKTERNITDSNGDVQTQSIKKGSFNHIGKERLIELVIKTTPEITTYLGFTVIGQGVKDESFEADKVLFTVSNLNPNQTFEWKLNEGQSIQRTADELGVFSISKLEVGTEVIGSDITSGWTSDSDIQVVISTIDDGTVEENTTISSPPQKIVYNPSIIGSIYDLQSIRLNLDNTYQLIKNINEGDQESEFNIDNQSTDKFEFTPMGSQDKGFTGILRGNGFAIHNISITSNASGVGLFNKIELGGVVSALGLVNVVVEGSNDVGVLAGENAGTVEAYAKGSISGQNNVGALVGVNSGIVKGYSNANVKGQQNVGGLVGSNTNKVVGYSTGVIEGSNVFGGLVGYNTGQVEGYFRGTLNKTSIPNLEANLGSELELEQDFIGFLVGRDSNIQNKIIGYYSLLINESIMSNNIERFKLAGENGLGVSVDNNTNETVFNKFIFAKKDTSDEELIGDWSLEQGHWPKIKIGIEDETRDIQDVTPGALIYKNSAKKIKTIQFSVVGYTRDEIEETIDNSKNEIVIKVPVKFGISKTSLFANSEIQVLQISVSDDAQANVQENEVLTQLLGKRSIRVMASDFSQNEYEVIIQAEVSNPQIEAYVKTSKLGIAIQDTLFKNDEVVFTISNVAENANFIVKINNVEKNYESNDRGVIYILKGDSIFASMSEWSAGQTINVEISFSFSEDSFNKEFIYQPNEIYTWRDLQAIRTNLNGDYTLQKDINLDEEIGDNNKQADENDYNFEPIGSKENPFTGVFNGNGKTIKNLYINKENEDEIGLFGVIGENGQANNVGLDNQNIIGKNNVGSIAGENKGTISGFSTGTVNGDQNVGGLAGQNSGTVQGFTHGTTKGNANVGGLVGENSGHTTGYAKGVVEKKEGDATSFGLLTGENIDAGTSSGFHSGIKGESVLKNINPTEATGDNGEQFVADSTATENPFPAPSNENEQGWIFTPGAWPVLEGVSGTSAAQNILENKNPDGSVLENNNEEPKLKSAVARLEKLEVELDGYDFVKTEIQTDTIVFTVAGLFGSPETNDFEVGNFTIAEIEAKENGSIKGVSKGSILDVGENTTITVVAENGLQETQYSVSVLKVGPEPAFEAYTKSKNIGQGLVDTSFEANKTVFTVGNLRANTEFRWAVKINDETQEITQTKISNENNKIFITKEDINARVTSTTSPLSTDDVIHVSVSLLQEVSGSTRTVSDNFTYKPEYIYTAQDLQAMRLTLDLAYEIKQNIDIDKELGNGNGIADEGDYNFEIIAPNGEEVRGQPFNGSLNGNNYNINNLYIHRPTTNYVGLFGLVGWNAEIKDIILEGNNIVGQDYVGSIAGENRGFVSVIHRGKVTGRGRVGGLIGENYGNVIGINEGEINGSVNIDRQNRDIGGIVGVTKSDTDKGVYGSNNGRVIGNYQVGGLVGDNSGRGFVKGKNAGAIQGNSRVGGLLGNNAIGILVGHSNAKISGRTAVGGLIGYNGYGTVIGYSDGTIEATNSNAGGLAGENSKTIVGFSYANVSGQNQIGGLVGWNFIVGSYEGKVTGYSTGNVEGQGRVGGLVGLNQGGVSGYSRGDIIRSSGSNNYFGHLVGEHRASSTANAESVYVTGFYSIKRNEANFIGISAWDVKGINGNTTRESDAVTARSRSLSIFDDLYNHSIDITADDIDSVANKDSLDEEIKITPWIAELLEEVGDDIPTNELELPQWDIGMSYKWPLLYFGDVMNEKVQEYGVITHNTDNVKNEGLITKAQLILTNTQSGERQTSNAKISGNRIIVPVVSGKFGNINSDIKAGLNEKFNIEMNSFELKEYASSNIQLHVQSTNIQDLQYSVLGEDHKIIKYTVEYELLPNIPIISPPRGAQGIDIGILYDYLPINMPIFVVSNLVPLQNYQVLLQSKPFEPRSWYSSAYDSYQADENGEIKITRIQVNPHKDSSSWYSNMILPQPLDYEKWFPNDENSVDEKKLYVLVTTDRHAYGSNRKKKQFTIVINKKNIYSAKGLLTFMLHGKEGDTYNLMNDIDFDVELGNNNGRPDIGDFNIQTNASLTASLEGNNYSIKNLYHKTIPNKYGGTREGGLFSSGGYATAIMQNLKFENAHIESNNVKAGIVAASIGPNVKLINVHASGTVIGSHNVGGLVGRSFGKIINSSFSGVVKGLSSVGGLVGQQYKGEIKQSYAEAEVGFTNMATPGKTNVGIAGLVGLLRNSKIDNSYSKGNVNGRESAGGLIGTSDNSHIINSYSTSNVKGTENTGGLVGKLNGINHIISNSYSKGNVNGEKTVGGFIGEAGPGKISNSYSTGKVTGNSNVGGFIGLDYYSYPPLEIQNSRATGDVKGISIDDKRPTNIGGFAGFINASQYNYLLIEDSFATGNVSAVVDANNIVNTDGINVGGFVGKLIVFYTHRYPSMSSIKNSYSAGNVIGYSNVGGFAGLLYMNLKEVHSLGNVRGIQNIGGLIGLLENNHKRVHSKEWWNGNTSFIIKGYSRGHTRGKQSVASLIGKVNPLQGTITGYATGNVFREGVQFCAENKQVCVNDKIITGLTNSTNNISVSVEKNY